MGRAFVRADEQAGGGPGGFKVVISYDFWKKHFGGDTNVLGRTIELDRRPYTVIGVMPAGFQFPIQSDPIDVYVTIARRRFESRWRQTGDRAARQSQPARHRAVETGVTVAQAQADLATIAANLEKQYPDTNTHFGVGVETVARGIDRRCAHRALCSCSARSFACC